MVKRLVLRNFQSWKVLDISFSDVNIIVGETNSGKSAILRALGALFFNNLEGTSFVHDGELVASIELTIDNNNIALTKSASINRYTLNGRVFDKIGRTVPDEIKEALRVKEIVFDDDTSLKLQIQNQMDAPFLLADQGVRATRLLGTVSKVATIYQAARLSSQKKKGKMAYFDALLALEGGAVERLRSYDYLGSLEPLMQEIANLASTHSEVETRIQAIALLVGGIKQAKSRTYAILSTRRQLEDSHKTLMSLVQNLMTQDGIQKVSIVLRNSRQRKEELTLAISKATVVVLVCTKLVCVLDDIISVENYLSLRESSLVLRQNIDKAEKTRNRCLIELKTLEAEFLCPVCGQEKK